eukprot:TRINITY_DN2711_c0_g1_i1.p1 TRINITY_DN2711_c0_g1~~TRINITY_DN2711_c0_g1_i1.p1  ORF type:complete len:127 (-),score=30.92 TRINITY_DN2711_c0_g1_i1:140-520(-)
MGIDTDTSRWVIVYPVYLSKRKTIAEGRKIGRDHCADNPTFKEVLKAAETLDLPVHPEPEKKYPREPYHQSGRIRVQLKNESELPVNPSIPNRTELYKAIARVIPTQRPTNNPTNTKGRKGRRKRK